MNDPGNRLRNIARGERGYHFHRDDIFRILLAGGLSVEQVSDFLLDKLLRLDPKRWNVLQFSEKDWKNLAALRFSTDPELEANYLHLIKKYAQANAKSVANLYLLEQKTSSQLLGPDDRSHTSNEEEIASFDSQSLFALRMQCAAGFPATEMMRENVERIIAAGWPHARMVAPLVYHMAHTPSPELLDSFLSYVLAGDEEEVEKQVIKLLLDDLSVQEASLAFKAYVGLICHPYDAIQLVLDHIEYALGNGQDISGPQRKFVESISCDFPDKRAAALLRIMSIPLPFLDRPHVEVLTERFDLDRVAGETYAAFCDVAPLDHAEIGNARRFIEILPNMRFQEVPDPLQFQFAVRSHALWSFTDAGRFVGALLRSIYMVNRTDRAIEARDLLRLIGAAECVTPFIASAPSAMMVVNNLSRILPSSQIDPESIEKRTDRTFAERRPFVDRLWINDLQWQLSSLEKEGRIDEWIRFASSNTKLRPSYLTGINWHWVEEVIAERRIRPFKSFAGAYVLLLMELEAPSHAQRLRLALKPLIGGKTFEDAVDLLLANFGQAAPAVVQRSLTTKNILALGFAQDHIAAMHMRVSALEKVILSHGFGALLTQELYESEVKALTAELSLSSINAGKFEVPWDSFRKDTGERNRDLFLAVQSLGPEDNPDRMSALIEVPTVFPGGRKETYRVRADRLALFHLIVSVFEGYLQHPAFGLEVILSARFRHNNLVQEIWSAIATVGAATIPSVPGNVRKALVRDYRAAVEEVVDAWCGEYMQTNRPTKPKGMFDIIPDEREMAELVRLSSEAEGLLAVTDLVIESIKSKLRTQIRDASRQFVETLGEMLRLKCDQVAQAQTEDAQYRAADVGKVASTLLDAIQRRLDDLTAWFDGIDDSSVDSIEMEALVAAIETIFENVFPDRPLQIEIDESIKKTVFAREEVKIAFDMIREIFTNAVRHGTGSTVAIAITESANDTSTVVFSNDAIGSEPCDTWIPGSRFEILDQTIVKDIKSGSAKIAAMSAAICQSDVRIRMHSDGKRYSLELPIEKKRAGAA